MSVLVKGMKMPKNCMLCNFCVEEADPATGEMCLVTGKLMPPCNHERLDDCPLIEVPPHMETAEWRSIKDRLPKGGDDSGELCENVILLLSVEYNENYITAGWINGVTKKAYYLDEKDDYIQKTDMVNVKAWMPLPEPPQESEE